jgi:hypothetical protein
VPARPWAPVPNSSTRRRAAHSNQAMLLRSWCYNETVFLTRGFVFSHKRETASPPTALMAIPGLSNNKLGIKGRYRPMRGFEAFASGGAIVSCIWGGMLLVAAAIILLGTKADGTSGDTYGRPKSPLHNHKNLPPMLGLRAAKVPSSTPVSGRRMG